jgi:uncharacterized iron-regulated protein
MRAPDAIERSQRSLYLSIKSELALFEKKKRKEIAAYERAYRSSLPHSLRSASKKDLVRQIKGASAVLVGDFHPFRQSQKGYLRLVEEALPHTKRAVLALECLQQAHQTAVNEYLAGYITVEELRDKIDFEKYWPFSWENYKEILVFAKRMNLPVLALNILERKRSPGMLRERDRAAAERAAAELRAHPDSCVFLLYGELHLARPHLPADLRRQLGSKAKVLVVHQNDPELYWRAPRQRSGQRPEVLKLSASEFCILNSVPWVKLRSYLDWLEGSPHSEDWEEGLDTAGTVHHYARLLAETIGLETQISESVEILGPEASAPKLGKLSALDRAFLKHSVTFQRTAYLRVQGTLLLPFVSTNSLSEAASFLLWHSCRKENAEKKKMEAHHRIAHFFVGYLGSKVLNPKRKCNEVADLRQMTPKKKGARSGKMRVAVRALGLLRPYLKGESLPRKAPPLAGAAELEACRLAGYVLGERFFLSLLMQPELLPFLCSWFEADFWAESKNLLLETAARIRAVSPSSKRDLF